MRLTPSVAGNVQERSFMRAHPRLTVTVIPAALVALLLAGCSSSTSNAPPVTAGTSPVQPAPTVTTPPPAGLPAFYGVPNPLPAGQPGDIVRTEQIDVPALHGTMWRVMYHSRSIRGDDIVVTGLIVAPVAAPPAAGFPVISIAHGTTGIADTCAPSLDPASNISVANALLDRGYLLAATDYEGLGTPGRHPYIVGVSEARGVLDIVRAARRLPAAHASSQYLVWGHSQGGHAAMFALHIADQWAPELHLVGVVAGAPPSQLQLIFAALQKSPFRYYLLMVAAGFNAAYGDQQAPLDAVLTPAGIADVGLVDHGCAGDLAAATASQDLTSIVKADPATVPAWATLLKDNDPGQFTTASAEPLLIIQGGSDEQIPVASSQLLFGELCKIGQTEQRWIYPGQSHAGVVSVSIGDMMGWISNRFAGKSTPDLMSPTGMVDVQTSRCPA
jgi:hypothetical protein